MPRRGVAALALLLGLGLAGVARSAASYVEAPVPDGGALVGRVRFVGEPPKAESLAVRKNTDVCGEQKPTAAPSTTRPASSPRR